MFKSAILLNAVSALITNGDSCLTATVPTKSNFNKSLYVGRWYEQKADFFWSGDCTTATYSVLPNTDVNVENRAWFWWIFFSYFTLTGAATCESAGGCWVTFNIWGNRPDTKSTRANYNVLDTDYNNYTIIYSCSNTWYGAK